MMLKDTSIRSFFMQSKFDLMLTQVGTDDQASFKNNNAWLATHPAEAIIFHDPEKTWQAIRPPYQATFRNLVIGTLPLESELTLTLQNIGARLKTITWKII
jgi:hypothetical protein